MASAHDILDAELARREQETASSDGPAAVLDAELTRRTATMGDKLQTGVYGQLADILGAPVDHVNRALHRAAQLVGVDMDAPKALKQAWREMGIIKDPLVDEATAKIGASALNGAIVLTGMGAGSQLLAVAPGVARQTPGAIRSVVETFNRGLVTRPEEAIMATAAGAAGGVKAEEWAREAGAGPVGTGLATVAGEMGGGMIGQSALRAGGRVAEGISKLGDRVFQGAKSLLGFGSSARPTTPVMPISGDITATRVFADEQLNGDRVRVGQAIEDTVRSVRPNATPEEASAASAAAVDRGYKVARRLEGRYWDDVPLKQQVPTKPLKDTLRGIIKEVEGQPYEWGIIQDNIRPLMKLQNTASIQALRSERTRIRDLREAIPPGQQAWLSRYYNQIENGLLDAAEQGLPGNTALKRAREFSRWLNTTFNDGPIGAIRNGQADPGQFVPKLQGQFGGFKALSALPGKPGRDAVAAAEDFYRSTFRDIADTNPQAGADFVVRNERNIKGLGRVHAELGEVSDTLNHHVATREGINKSQLARFVESADPQQVIKDVINSKLAPQNMRQIVQAVRTSPEAMEGLQAGVIEEFYARAGGSGRKFMSLMNDPKNYRMLSEALNPDQLARLNKMARAAQGIELGETRFANSVLADVLAAAGTGGAGAGLAVGAGVAMAAGPIVALPAAGTLLARFIGARVGSHLSHMAGGRGTIQIPAYVANAFQRKAVEMFGKIDSTHLFKLGVINPHWEQILLSRAPTTEQEVQRLITRLRRTVNAMQGSVQGVINALEKDEE